MLDTLVPVLLLLMLALPVGAAEYYLSPQGSDDGPGTRAQPWKTLGKANAVLQPGDTAVLLEGEYPGAIAPERSGAAEAPITYRSEKPLGATLTAASGVAALNLQARSHVVIEGFHIDPAGGNWVKAVRCDHLTIRGCVMRDAGPEATIAQSEQVRLIDNVFRKDRVTGNMWGLRECSYVLLEGNQFSHVGHSPIQITSCRNVVVRANLFCNPWGRNYEFWASGRLLIEGNLITRARDSAYSADSRAKNLYVDSIFRHNVIFGNLHTPLNSMPYLPMGARPTSYFREPFRLQNSRLYNNTFAGNLGHAYEVAGMSVSNNDFANNLFWHNDWTSTGLQFLYADRLSSDNRIRHNLFCGTEPGQKALSYRGQRLTVEEANTKARLLEGFWSEVQDNLEGDPRFLKAEANDFRLGEGSAALEAGTPLALAMGEGRGRVLPVTDGLPFYDGFGVEGESGDWIAVGEGNNLARIERVELRYYLPALLHLDREVSWTDGQPVSLPWTGKAPDIGARERGLEHPCALTALASPAYPRPGETVTFSVDTGGKSPQNLRWDFRDGTFSSELSPTHQWPDIGDRGVMVRCEFPGGEHAVAVVLVGVQEPIDPAAPLVQGDFEDATEEGQWGYHFKFYRSWLTGYQRVPRETGGKCMHLFYQQGKDNRAAGAVAPGVWEIERYPTVRFAYRIPAGVPVGLCAETFESAPSPRGWILGGTSTRIRSGYPDLNLVTLEDDDQWHEATVDLRKLKAGTPELRYLWRFMFQCDWKEDRHQEFWFDDFAIQPQ